jgi:peptidoglycan/LPS O-acetylase OafA/YrhL
MDIGTAQANLIKPLTSVRFFAAIFVVMYHSGSSFIAAQAHVPGPLKTLLLNGYLGVTFFFVLSGFILQLTYRGKIAGFGQVKKFGLARLARIYPVYALAILAMIPFVTLKGWGDVPQFLLLQSWIPYGALGWNTWNMPTWTLSVELFFYLCFPIISCAASAADTRWLAATILGLLCFDAITASSAVSDNANVAFGWMHWTPIPLLRLPEFVIGICAAELSKRGNRVPIQSWVPAVVLLAGMSLSSTPRMSAFATAMAVLLVAAVASDRGSRFAAALSTRWLVLLGGASYSLYLMHQPVHFYMTWQLGEGKWLVPLQYFVVIGGSVLVFLYIEEPAREWIRSRVKMKPSAIEEVADRPL